MQKIDQLRNLLVMAASDGKLAESEISFLTERCRNWGVSDADFAQAIEYALSPNAELTIPYRKAERVRVLEDMMNMMAADGSLADLEMDIFALVAAKMEISDEELNRIIDSLTKAKPQRGSA